MDSFTKGLIITGVIVLVLVGICVIIEIKCPVEYVMPNGVSCYFDNLNRATHEFNWCSDGKTYINPENYDIKNRYDDDL